MTPTQRPLQVCELNQAPSNTLALPWALPCCAFQPLHCPTVHSQFLMQQGIPENDAVRIIVYRDKVAARATRPAPQSRREAVAAVAAGVPVAAVPFTMAATTTTTATATVTVSQTVLGGTEPTVQAEEGGSRRCSRRSSNPRVVRTPGSRETLAVSPPMCLTCKPRRSTIHTAEPLHWYNAQH